MIEIMHCHDPGPNGPGIGIHNWQHGYKGLVTIVTMDRLEPQNIQDMLLRPTIVIAF